MEYEPVRTDMVALLKGFTRVRRDKYHVLRIGRLSDESPGRIFQQMNNNGTLITTPPSIRALRAKQRRFGRKVWPLIMRTLWLKMKIYTTMSARTWPNQRIQQLRRLKKLILLHMLPRHRTRKPKLWPSHLSQPHLRIVLPLPRPCLQSLLCLEFQSNSHPQ